MTSTYDLLYFPGLGFLLNNDDIIGGIVILRRTTCYMKWIGICQTGFSVSGGIQKNKQGFQSALERMLMSIGDGVSPVK